MVLQAAKRMRRGTRSNFDNEIFYMSKYDLLLRDYSVHNLTKIK